MNTPIKREDIRKGDRINVKYEYTAASDNYGPIDMHDVAYELIERPVQLPTEPGHYVDKYDGWVYLAADGTWTDSSEYDLDTYTIASRAPFTRMRPVAEVAAEVLAEVRGRSILRNSDGISIRHLVLENIGAEFGATK